MISPLHDSYSAIQDLKHSTPVSMHSVCCPKILTTKSAENKVDVPISMWDRDCELPSPQEDAIKKQPLFQCSSCPIIPSYGGDSENSSHTTYNSDLGSLGSPQVGSDVFSFSSTPSSSECQAPLDCVDEVPGAGPSVEEPSPQHSPLHQRHSPSPIPSCSPMSTSPPLAEANQHFLEANNPAPNAVKSDVWAPAKQIDIKVWLKTLQYFQGVPVHHPFFQNVVQEKDAEQVIDGRDQCFRSLNKKRWKEPGCTRKSRNEVMQAEMSNINQGSSMFNLIVGLTALHRFDSFTNKHV